MRVPDRGTTDHPLESKSAQTNGDRGWSRGAGCRRHRGARARAERWRLDRAHADHLGARDDAAGVLVGDPRPVHDASSVLPGDDPARVEHDRDDVAVARADVLAATADHVDQADPAGDHAAAPDDHLAAGLRAAVLPRDDAAGVVVPGPLRSHR